MKQATLGETSKDFKAALETPLGQAMDKFVGLKSDQAELKDKLTLAGELVVIEMKKAKKDYIKTQIDGHFVEFEITRANEKLKFKKLV